MAPISGFSVHSGSVFTSNPPLLPPGVSTRVTLISPGLMMRRLAKSPRWRLPPRVFGWPDPAV